MPQGNPEEVLLGVLKLSPPGAVGLNQARTRFRCSVLSEGCAASPAGPGASFSAHGSVLLGVCVEDARRRAPDLLLVHPKGVIFAVVSASRMIAFEPAGKPELRGTHETAAAARRHVYCHKNLRAPHVPQRFGGQAATRVASSGNRGTSVDRARSSALHGEPAAVLHQGRGRAVEAAAGGSLCRAGAATLRTDRTPRCRSRLARAPQVQQQAGRRGRRRGPCPGGPQPI